MHDAVVKVFATIQSSNYASPWQASLTESSTGSGVVVAKGRILTGAHVVADATFLEVQKLSHPDKSIARVLAISHDSDLALLEVEGDEFMDDVEAAQIGDLPSLQDRVSVLGYPVGGEELSVTEGVVSRMEVQTYAHSQRRLLAGTVDAAINDGNSGGPVVKDDKVVGIAFQSLEDAENIGEMVPTPIIQHFLACVAAGRPPILPAMGVGWQGMQNPELRRAHGLTEGQSGVLVTSVSYASSADGIFETGDVLHSIAGHAIAGNGTVRYRDRFRLAWYGILCEYYVDDVIAIEWSRAGKLRTSQVRLLPPANLVAPHSYDRIPTYFVYGGIVFQPLTLEYLREWNNWWEKAPRELVQLYYRGVRSEACQEVVILSMVLADRVNVGYDGIADERVISVAGIAPRDMAHFVDLVEGTQGLLTIQTSGGLSIVLDTELAREAGPRVLQRYRIPADRSADLAGR